MRRSLGMGIFMLAVGWPAIIIGCGFLGVGVATAFGRLFNELYKVIITQSVLPWIGASQSMAPYVKPPAEFAGNSCFLLGIASAWAWVTWCLNQKKRACFLCLWAGASGAVCLTGYAVIFDLNTVLLSYFTSPLGFSEKQAQLIYAFWVFWFHGITSTPLQWSLLLYFIGLKLKRVVG